MNTRLAGILVRLIAGVGFFASAGCSILPESGSDPARFYLLSVPAGAAAPKADAPSIVVRQVELANYLRSRPVIVRRGANEIEFREYARWGEPIEQGIARVIREELLARGVAGAVQIPGGRRENIQPDYALTVRVLACEGSAAGEVIFRAVWELATTGAKPRPIGSGDFRPVDLHWDGKTEASLVAQLSQAVAGLVNEIAAAVPKKG